MSKKEESSWLDILGTMKKFNPVAFILLLVLMYASVTVFNLDIALEKKIIPLALSGSLYLIGVFFEFYRIEKNKEVKEEAWRKGVFI